MNDQIKEAIAKTILSMGETISPQELGTLTDKIVKKSQAAKKFDLNAYCFIVGRNWAISLRRKRVAAQRQNLRVIQEEKKIQDEKDRVGKLKEEFLVHYMEILPTINGLAVKHLSILWMKFIMEWDDQKIATIFSGSTPMQRRQWSCRGRKILSQKCSEDLIKILGGR